jgi:protease I
MAEKQLKGMRVAIIATDGYEQIELVAPRKALEEAGAETTVIAPASGKIQGMKHDEKADKVDVDMTLGKAKASDFDAVLLPGGALNADALRVEKGAQEFVREMRKQGNRLQLFATHHGSWFRRDC